MDIIEHVKALVEMVEKGMLKAVRETKVKFVLCADSGLGMLHIKKNGAACWCGRRWSKVCRKNAQRWTDAECLRSLASSWAGGDVVLGLDTTGHLTHRLKKGTRSVRCLGWSVPSRGARGPWCAKRARGWGVANRDVRQDGWRLGCPRLLRCSRMVISWEIGGGVHFSTQT